MRTPGKVEASAFSADVLEFVRLLSEHRVEYVIVGGTAVIFHGYPRLTGDIDFFFDARLENATRLFQALAEFWNGSIPGLRQPAELTGENMVLQFGRPPHRIDLLNWMDGVDFAEAWDGRETVEINGASPPLFTHYLGKATLLKAKRASGRPKDLDDVEQLS